VTATLLSRGDKASYDALGQNCGLMAQNRIPDSFAFRSEETFSPRCSRNNRQSHARMCAKHGAERGRSSTRATTPAVTRHIDLPDAPRNVQVVADQRVDDALKLDQRTVPMSRPPRSDEMG